MVIQRKNSIPLSSIPPKMTEDGKYICLNCNIIIPFKRCRKYCSETCSQDFWAKHNFSVLRIKIFFRDNFTCAICHVHEKDLPKKEYNGWRVRSSTMIDQHLCADHIIPVALGGAEFEESNIQTLCELCHKIKTKTDMANIAKLRKTEKLVSKGKNVLTNW